MTRFSASLLDLSRVDRTALWPARSFEGLRAARLIDLKARLNAAGIPYDLEVLETDPGVYLQETGAYRELLTGQAIDDAQAKVLLAFAWGPWLDRLGDMHGCARMDGESDTRYRGRVQLAPEAFASSGTPGGYIYHAMSADVNVRDAYIVIHNRGTYDVSVEVSILSAIGAGVPPLEMMNSVRARLYRDDIKLLTDTVVVRPAVVINYDVVATLYFRPGPDPAMAKTLAETSLRAVADRYKRLGGEVPRNVIDSALYVANVDRVVVTVPASDLIMKSHQAAKLVNVWLNTLVDYE